jgi:signal transduction histidine kinase
LERDEQDTPATLLTYSVDISARKQAEQALQQAKDDLELRVAERTGELNATNAHLAARQEELERLTATLQAQAHDLVQQATQLADANRDLAQKNDENEMFVYSVSHDLRSPLVNLQGFSQELALVGKDLRGLLASSAVPQATRDEALELLDGDMADSLRFIQAAVSRLGAIIDALLRLSRAGRLEYQRQTVDTGAIVSRVVDAAHETIEARAACVTVEPLAPSWGDPTALEQIFANLIGNALNYLDPQRPGQIEVCCAPPQGDVAQAHPGCLVYSVRDNGLGIPEHAREKVFQIFQRLHPQAASGEGLGLALVRRIVERHQGAIWVESVEGKGSAFFVALPQHAGGASNVG